MHVDNCSDTIYQTPLTILQPALNAMYLSISHDNTPELNVVCADKFEIMIQHRIERHESVLSFSDFDLFLRLGVKTSTLAVLCVCV